MKNFLLLFVVLSINIINLYPQTEWVIESFDNWSGGLPEGWEWYPGNDTLTNAVEMIPGYIGSAMKLIDLNNPIPQTDHAIRTIYHTGTFPDSIAYYIKGSIPVGQESRIEIRFYYDGNFIDNLYTNWFSLPDWSRFVYPSNWPNNTAIDKIEMVLTVVGNPSLNNEWAAIDEITFIWNSTIQLIQPTGGIKWIAGEKRMIQWTALNDDDTLKIEYSTDGGASFTLIEDSIVASAGNYEWDIPEDMLTTKARIKITNLNDNNTAESEDFRIKPYIITRLDNNGDYVVYDIDYDRWGFGNSPQEMWPVWWWLRFNYQVKIDTFTNKQFSQSQGDSVFAKAHMSDFPDWYSFVRAFSVSSCYRHTGLGIYCQSALLKWKSKKRLWRGSCFGIAAANALAFRKRSEFQLKYPYFPAFVDPVNVQSDSNVIPVITELFTHQWGNPTVLHRDNSWNPDPGKTVNETLQEIKAMLVEDNTPIKTLSFWNNSGNGGHTINPYLLEQDPVDKWLYYLFVWDNAYPNNTSAIITIDTTLYSNKGRWDPDYGNYPNWGGDKWFMLEVLSDNYLNYAILPKSSASQSPSLYWPMGVEIDITENSDIIIKDSLGNRTGYADGNVLNEIPYGLPLILTNPVDTPPYGYLLDLRNYSVVLDNFQADTIDAYFFSQNKGFSYERYGAVNTETDRLFFDGGISAVNPDNQAKTVKLLSLIDDTTSAEDKMIVIKSLTLEQNDSVKIIPIDDNNFRLISYGSAKEYAVGLEYASESQWQIFGNNSVQLSANTTHTFVPNWPNIYNSQLTILVDEGNNGTIDDTLHVVNQVTDVKDDQGSLLIPDEYRLEQNYPNPFNSTTVIKYRIPKEELVTLDIYNVIGEKVMVLVNEVKPAGSYEVEFDGNELTSGIYFYQLKAKDFVETKKMVLMK